MRFAFVIIETDRSRHAIATDRAAHRAAIEAWMGAQARAGVLLGGEAFETEKIAPVTVRRADDLSPLVTDGPFAGPAETLGGFVLVEVADRAAAVELATTWPPSGEALEIRPVWEA